MRFEINLDYFFSKPEDIPEEYLWSMYDKVHLTWLALIALACIVSCILFKRSTTEKQDKVLKGLALWIAFQEILKDLLHWYAGMLEMELLPLHICGISIFFTLWYAFKPGPLNAAYIYGMSLPGALCAELFADWTNYPWWHFSALNSFTIHAELIIFAMMALTSGRLKPDIRQIPKMTIIMYALAVPIYFLNKRWDTNFMFINTPSPGSPLVPLYNIFGDGYVIAAAILVVLVWIILFLPWYIFSRSKATALRRL